MIHTFLDDFLNECLELEINITMKNDNIIGVSLTNSKTHSLYNCTLCSTYAIGLVRYNKYSER
ncbi:LOW QUALITY PROTEIN: hypothetical protein V1478_003672 [Vespula squamosa]|uniref:Uncharacterized protein n=1 Tax=Vespula squamosa TaxID=30214 RepID=A0ABD2BMG6_VESSQ